MASPHDELLALARSLARRGGELAARRRRDGVSVAATKSSLVDVVTEADREVEHLIRHELQIARPDDGFLGEESGQADALSEYTWIIDPIDGTVNYLYGQPNWAVSVAVVSGPPRIGEWKPVAGAVFAPALGVEYWAQAGEGSFRNGERIEVSRPESLAVSLVATGFSYRADQRAVQAATLQNLLTRARDIRRLGSAALDSAGVGAGLTDAYYEIGVQPWDYAAGALIASEAGAVVETLRIAGDERTGLLVSAPAIRDELRDAIGARD